MSAGHVYIYIYTIYIYLFVFIDIIYPINSIISHVPSWMLFLSLHVAVGNPPPRAVIEANLWRFEPLGVCGHERCDLQPAFPRSIEL